MGADADAVLGGEPDGLIHQVRIAGMKARRNIGRADERHEGRVIRIAHIPAAEGFAHVAVDVDCLAQCLFPHMHFSTGKTLGRLLPFEKFYFYI
jgi:hypothetical protein